MTIPSVSTPRRPGPTCAACLRCRRTQARIPDTIVTTKVADRQANSALWRIVMVRIAHDPETQAYFERRVKEGRSKRNVIRILKRYVAREVYRHLPRG